MFKLQDEIIFNPGLEAISSQVNDPAIKQLENVIEELKSAYDTRSYSKKLNVTSWILEIEKIILKRFGFKVKIELLPKTKSNQLSYCNIVGFDNDGGLKNVSALIDEIKKVPSEKLTKDFKETLDNVGLMDRWAKFNGIVVDEEKATISNLPSDFSTTIHLNVDFLFRKTNELESRGVTFSVREIVSIILYEVGNIFTSISYAYKTRMSRIVFEDVIKDQQKKGTEPKQQIIIAYKEAFDKRLKSDEFKNLNTFRTGMLVLKKMVDRRRYDRFKYDGSRRSSTDSDFASDQFVARFGYGLELSTIYRKFSTFPQPFIVNDIFDFDIYEMIYLVLLIAHLISVPAIISVVGLGASWAGFIILIMLGIVGYVISYRAITTLIDTIGSSKGRVADRDPRKIERISNDLVRQLRTESDKLPPEYVKKLIRDIDALDSLSDKIIKLGVEGKNLPTNKFFEFISSNYVNLKNLEELDVLMEDLMENRLHVVSKRF